MKHKFLFILPRLAGLTLLVGVAALVLFLLFKLLILAVVIGVVVAIAGKILSKARQRWAAEHQLSWAEQPHFKPLNGPAPFQANEKDQQAGLAIIPIS
ncbi:hypothetical protein [Niabella beijingensis]|uniref:hypothetical protein n=1 Tax=Niabella beijingensis TaxID=2872700 RepID=UPI001CBE8444|nr:hypothetical protein [Niabella beijingensis]MBZ4190976.1 hypothetical protein [Niabella beijingensis]